MDSPIAKATFQSAVLSAISNVLAQLITCWRIAQPYTLNSTELFQFVLFSALACPPNYIWQSWLEAQFPAHADTLSPLSKEALVDEAFAGQTAREKDVKRSSAARQAEKATLTNNSLTQQGPKKLNIKNTGYKFLFDQVIGAPLNNVLFIAGIGLIRGQSLDAILHDLQTQFWPMMIAGSKLWPFVSILCFTLVPLEYRMLVGSTAGLFWGIYLSLVSSEKK